MPQYINPTAILQYVGLKKNMNVADFGCGAGFFALSAAKLIGHGIVYGVDILKSSLSHLESRSKAMDLPNIRTVWSNVEILGATDIPEKSIDLLIVSGVMSLTKKHEAVLEEAKRLCKPTGRILVIDWKTDAVTSLGPNPKRRIAPEELIKYAQNIGLAQMMIFDATEYQYGLVLVPSQ